MSYQPPPPSGPPAGGASNRGAMLLAHLSAPVAFVVSVGFLSFVGPLVIWLMFKDRDPGVRTAAAGAFNFNISFWVLYILGWVVGIVTLTLGFVVVVPFWIAIFLVAAYCHIKGAIWSTRGQVYRYPFQLPILRS